MIMFGVPRQLHLLFLVASSLLVFLFPRRTFAAAGSRGKDAGGEKYYHEGDVNGVPPMVEEVLDYRTYCETMAGLLLNLLLGYC